MGGGWNKGLVLVPKRTKLQQGGWNRFNWKIISPIGQEYIVTNSYAFCKEHNLSWSSLYWSYKQGQALSKGKYCGWQLLISN